MATPSLSVVIPTYNRRDVLPRVLAPLLADEAVGEIVVVVDGSRDGSLELLEELAQKDARVQPLFIENSGEGRARYAGVERSKGEVVLLLDDDVLAQPGLAGGHARHHAERPDLVVLGYMPLAPAPVRRRTRVPVSLYANAYEQRSAAYEQEPERILLSFWAGNFSIRRADFLRLGRPEVGLVVGEDRDFGIRCHRAGLHAVFDRSLLSYHLYDRSLSSFRREAQGRGRTAAAIHRRHGDVVGPASPQTLEEGIPRPAAWLLRTTRRHPRLATVAATSLTAAVDIGCRLGVDRAATPIARLLRRLEYQRGMLDPGA